jgi:hypothetical protein
MASSGEGFRDRVVVQKKGGCFRWIGIAVVVFLGIIVIGVIASGGSKKSSSSSSSSNADKAPLAIGATDHTGDFDVLLKAVQNPYMPANQFERAPAGQHFVAVEILATNTADDQKTLSTLLGLEVHDAQSRAWNIAIAGTDLPQLDGTLAKGESRDGWAVFAVADDATGLTLRIKGDVTSTGAVFSLG